MIPIIESNQTTKLKTKLLTKTAPLYKTILQAMEDKKAAAIVSIDLRKIAEAPARFFIICEANNSTQIKAIAASVEEKVWEKTKEKPYRTEGLVNLQWVIVGYVDVVVHIMHPDARAFYQLEEMWMDANIETLSVPHNND